MRDRNMSAQPAEWVVSQATSMGVRYEENSIEKVQQQVEWHKRRKRGGYRRWRGKAVATLYRWGNGAKQARWCRGAARRVQCQQTRSERFARVCPRPAPSCLPPAHAANQRAAARPYVAVRGKESSNAKTTRHSRQRSILSSSPTRLRHSGEVERKRAVETDRWW